MKWPLMLVTVFVAALLERYWPAIDWLGRARLPLLISIVVYYSLRHDLETATCGAFLAGLLLDLLGRQPLGYMTALACVLAWIIARCRDAVLTDSPISHAVFVAFAGLVAPLLTWALLRQAGLPPVPWTWLLVRSLATAILGLLTAPLVFIALDRIERSLGVDPEGTLLHEAEYQTG